MASRQKSEIRQEAEFLCKTRPDDGNMTLARVLAENHGMKLEAARSMIRNVRGNNGTISKSRAVVPKNNGKAGEARKAPMTDKEIAETKAASFERSYLIANDRVKVLQRENDKLKREVHAAEQTIEDVINSVPAFVPSKMDRRKRPTKSSATAVLCCSDWHYEERIDPRKINGLNEHDRSICRARVDLLASKALEQIEMFNQVHDIQKLVIWLGGDFISGNIHDELLETCEVSPADAIAEVGELITNFIETMDRSGIFRKIEVVFTDGNHGRATQKIRVATRTGNSWESLMARMLAMAFRKYPNMDWHVAEGDQIIHEVEGRKWRFLHGDAIRYQGGIGGLSIPANKAIKQWNEAVPCYHTVFGHWHTYLRDRLWTCNGSSIGYSEFAQRIKASYEPPQQALIVADSEGIRQNTAIQLAKGTV